MLLQERNFYKIDGIAGDTAAATVQISINPECSVFNGHFPGYPIVPGVCSMQTVRECAQTVLGKEVFMNNVIQCRFRKLTDPNLDGNLTVDMQFVDIDGGKRLNAVMHKGEDVFMELKAELSYV